MLDYWNIVVLENWIVGIMEFWINEATKFCIIPTFHYSIIPLFQHSINPLFQHTNIEALPLCKNLALGVGIVGFGFVEGLVPGVVGFFGLQGFNKCEHFVFYAVMQLIKAFEFFIGYRVYYP